MLIFFDNYPAHPKEINEKFETVKVCDLPNTTSKTTSKLQPMNQGVLQSFKLQYSRRIIRKVITALEKNQLTENPIRNF